MKKLSLVIGYVLIFSSFASHAGSALKDAIGAEFELVSYTYLGMKKDTKFLRLIDVDRKTSMMLFRDGDQEFLTYCRGTYDYDWFPLPKKLIALSCVTQDGRTRVKYKVVN